MVPSPSAVSNVSATPTSCKFCKKGTRSFRFEGGVRIHPLEPPRISAAHTSKLWMERVVGMNVPLAGHHWSGPYFLLSLAFCLPIAFITIGGSWMTGLAAIGEAPADHPTQSSRVTMWHRLHLLPPFRTRPCHCHFSSSAEGDIECRQ
jgi:hypothetical protein